MNKLNSDIKSYLIDQLDDLIGVDSYGCDLSHSLLNQDYFIIGTYKAEQWLGEFAFDAIGEIQDYEKDLYGEIFTDFGDAEKVANMYCLIKGEELLSMSNHYNNKHDEVVTKKDLIIIKKEIESSNLST